MEVTLTLCRCPFPMLRPGDGDPTADKRVAHCRPHGAIHGAPTGITGAPASPAPSLRVEKGCLPPQTLSTLVGTTEGTLVRGSLHHCAVDVHDGLVRRVVRDCTYHSMPYAVLQHSAKDLGHLLLLQRGKPATERDLSRGAE